MSKTWPLVTLGEVIDKSQNWINLDAQEEYKEVTVRLWGKGVTLRGIVTGSQIAGSRRLQVHNNQFILSRIDARNGAFGLIPEELDNAVVSNDFPVFEINQNRLSPEYLHWLSKTKDFVESCKSVSEGTTNRVRLKEEKFIQIQIPLPPLAEQQRIVAKIERLARKIEDAHFLRKTNIQCSDSLFEVCRSNIIKRSFSNGKRKIVDAVVLERGKFSHRPRNDPRFFGGDHPWIQIGEIEASDKYIHHWYQTLNEEGLAISRKFPKGTLLISIAATIGAVGILEFDCCVPDSIVAITPKEWVDIGFLFHYLGYLRTHLEDVAPQSAQKNINLQILSELPFPDISIKEQHAIANYLDSLKSKVANLKAIQAHTTAELDAMLPSILDKAFKGEL